ncbi:MAG: flagellar biosynthesis protein FlhB [Candidatus Eremiobacteraeota bacterium]|jgi:flagellar biosynthetic protein FlhB|nr:flagellar biosynthesis protein FlhB [Candidatus Eremiobacteraeota bacterium]
MARPDQTEKATPKRKREARARGQVARSQDIGGAAIFIAIIVALHTGFMATMDAAAQAFQVALTHAGAREELNLHSVWNLFVTTGLPYAPILIAAFASAIVIAVVANLLQFGLLFSPGLLAPKFSKLNPLTGLQRIFFSPQTLVQLAKQLLKLGVVIAICWLGVKDSLTTFYALGHAAPRDIVLTVEGIVYGIGIKVGVLLLVLGIADYVWERRRLEQSLKMTKVEVKDEHKQSEGNPESRQALRQRQRAMARKRMMAAVPKATVIVTNPTHYAVALMWDELTMDAPVLVAKGADLIAKRIRDLATENGVPIMENPPLARTLYAKVELDSPVPPDLYAAVAQVIAFVYKLKNRSVSSA